MDLDERVERWEKEHGAIHNGDDACFEADELLRDLIADWRRLQADNARLRHVFSLQALDDVE